MKHLIRDLLKDNGRSLGARGRLFSADATAGDVFASHGGAVLRMASWQVGDRFWGQLKQKPLLNFNLCRSRAA